MRALTDAAGPHHVLPHSRPHPRRHTSPQATLAVASAFIISPVVTGDDEVDLIRSLFTWSDRVGWRPKEDMLAFGFQPIFEM